MHDLCNVNYCGVVLEKKPDTSLNNFEHKTPLTSKINSGYNN